MEKPESRCRICGAGLLRQRTGRPRRYCSVKCRREVEYARRRRQRLRNELVRRCRTVERWIAAVPAYRDYGSHQIASLRARIDLLEREEDGAPVIGRQ